MSKHLAPSEKHLEDWLVDNLHVLLYDPLNRRTNRLIARQMTLPSGVLDILYTDGYFLTIVELKREAIDHKAIAQVIRYSGDIDKLIWQQQFDIHYDKLFGEFPYDSVFDYEYLNKVVIGRNIKDRATQHLANSAGIILYTYEYKDGVYQFYGTSTRDIRERQQQFVGEATPSIINEIRQCIFNVGEFRRNKSK